MKFSKLLILLAVIVLVGSFFMFDGHQYFSLSQFRDWVSANALAASLTYLALYVFVTALSIPGAAAITLIGGAVFGFWWGLVLVSFASSIGATLAFLLSRTLFGDWVGKKFVEIGYRVLDPSQIVALKKSDDYKKGIDNPTVAAELGRRFGADIIIVGEAFSESAPDFNGMKSCRARVEARAIETSTGRILATEGTHAGGVDRSESVAAKTALRNAGDMIADYFLEQLCSKNIQASQAKIASIGRGNTQNSNASTTMNIVLNEINFVAYRKLQRSIKANKWITLVGESYKSKTARLEIQITKTADDVADFLLNMDGAKLNVTDFSENLIVASAK